MNRLILAALVLAACGTDDPAADGDSDVVVDTVTLAFSASDGVQQSSQLEDPLVGDVIGSIYLAADVSVTGPRDGAEAVADVSVDAVDLREVDVSAETWTSEPLPPDVYVFLGFWDLDGNRDPADPGPDAGDPVPLATTNVFTITEGENTTATAEFQIIFN